MAEVKTLLYQKPIIYHGLADIKGLYKMIDKWLKEHFYDKVEINNNEQVKEDGKQIILELMPYKKISDYAKVEIHVWCEMTNCKEEVIERSGVQQKIYKADILFSFDCYLNTDYEAHWQTKPTYFFFRTLVDKFVYKNVMNRYEKEAMSDCNEFMNEIKAYLNMERFS